MFMIALFVAVLAVLLVLWQQSSGLNVPSFAIAKGMKLLLPNHFPANNSASVNFYRSLYNSASPPTPFAGNMTITYVPSKQGHQIPIRIYNPSPSSSDLLPVFIWYHGGGMVLGSPEADHHKAILLSKLSKGIVVSVDYRLAPEHMFPAAADDALEAFQWVAAHAKEFGGDANQIIIGGESAGGNMAAGVASTNNNVIPLKGVVLIYPVLDFQTIRSSHVLHDRTTGLLPTTQMLWFWALYIGYDQLAKGCEDNYVMCPFFTPDDILRNYPKTTVILAKHDVLHDEGHAFANRLRKNGVPTTLQVYDDSVHSFFAISDLFETQRRCNEFLGQQLQSMLSAQ